MRLSLQAKFILVTFLAVFGITTVISLVTAAKTRSALYLATEKQGRILAQTVSALIINELIYEKLGLVEEGGLIDNYMRDLHQRSDIALNYVAVLDNALHVISHSDFREFGKTYSSGFIREGYNEMVARIRKANEEMKLAHEKLLQSEKLATLGVLSSSVAHRINNPLGGLFNCASMLRRKREDPEFRTDYLALI